MNAFGLSLLLSLPLFISSGRSLALLLCLLLLTRSVICWGRTYYGHYLLLGLTPIDCSILPLVFYFMFIHPGYFCSCLDSRVRSLSDVISPTKFCRKTVRTIPPSWSLIKWLIRVFVGLAFQAELPSNPSLSSFLRVPLQLMGCTGSPTLSSTTTPSGASVLQVLSAL